MEFSIQNWCLMCNVQGNSALVQFEVQETLILNLFKLRRWVLDSGGGTEVKIEHRTLGRDAASGEKRR